MLLLFFESPIHEVCFYKTTQLRTMTLLLNNVHMLFLAKLASLSVLHTSIQSVFHFNYLGPQRRKQ